MGVVVSAGLVVVGGQCLGWVVVVVAAGSGRVEAVQCPGRCCGGGVVSVSGRVEGVHRGAGWVVLVVWCGRVVVEAQCCGGRSGDTGHRFGPDVDVVLA